jgi:peptidoglycan/LPS O-acetylase OafA/YrhL
MPRIAFVDGVRVLAQLWVVLFHVQFFCALSHRDIGAYILRTSGSLISVGHLGVDVLFALSGFLLGLNVATKIIAFVAPLFFLQIILHISSHSNYIGILSLSLSFFFLFFLFVVCAQR